MVKQAFLDSDLKVNYRFSSANSINIARLIPQSFYYFEALGQIDHTSSRVTFVVPSGNFGNLTAGLLAQKMGLPVEGFVAAVNSNQAFLDYITSGNYSPRPSIATLSNAMDVGDPSNFPRLVELSGSTWNMVKDLIKAYSFTDEDTAKAILEINSLFNYHADPHGAVGYLACKENLKKNNNHHVFLETAHPAKFREVFEDITGYKIDLPPQLQLFENKQKHAHYCSSSFEDFKEMLMNL